MDNNDKELKKKMLKAVAIQQGKKGSKVVPRVIAAGYGSIAERIVEIAKKNNIDVEKNEDSNIVKWEIVGLIPDQTYAVVSEMLSFVYKLDEESKKK